MSLVGTRPPTVDEWEQYELHHRSRMSTKPGITGMWQVSGRSDITDFEEVVRLDTEYIQNYRGHRCRKCSTGESSTYLRRTPAGRRNQGRCRHPVHGIY